MLQIEGYDVIIDVINIIYGLDRLMKYSTLLLSDSQNDITASIKAVKSAGFENVFLTLNSDITRDDISKVVSSGLVIQNIHLPYNVPCKFINSLWKDEDETKTAIELLKNGIDIAYDFRVDTVVLHASSSWNPPEKSEIGIANYRYLADYCADKNITLAIENIKRVDYVEYLLDSIPMPNIKFCFDVGHANAFSKNLYSYNWERMLSRLHCIHMHDNDGQNDQHLIPGMGNVKWGFVLPKLMEAKKDLIITAEVYYKGREKFYTDVSSQDELYPKIYDALTNITKRYL